MAAKLNCPLITKYALIDIIVQDAIHAEEFDKILTNFLVLIIYFFDAFEFLIH